MTSGTRSSTGGSRRSPRRRSSTAPASPAARSAHLEHRARRVDADHPDAVARDRHRDPPGSDRELDDRAARTRGLLEVEGHVLGDAPAPRVVDLSDRVVFAHGFTLSFPRGHEAQRFSGGSSPGRTLTRPSSRRLAAGDRGRRDRRRARGGARAVPRTKGRPRAGSARGAGPRERHAAERDPRAPRGGARKRAATQSRARSSNSCTRRARST